MPLISASNVLFFRYDDTALHTAADEGHLDIVQLLLSCNADVDALDGWYRPYAFIVDALLIFKLYSASDV